MLDVRVTLGVVDCEELVLEVCVSVEEADVVTVGLCDEDWLDVDNWLREVVTELVTDCVSDVVVVRDELKLGVAEPL